MDRRSTPRKIGVPKLGARPRSRRPGNQYLVSGHRAGSWRYVEGSVIILGMGKQTDGGLDFGEAVAGEDEDLDLVARALVKDLELGEGTLSPDQRDLSQIFGAFLKLPNESIKRVGLDLSVVAGLSGDWNLALQFVLRLLECNDDRIELKLWELRCLVECHRYAEALALNQSAAWPLRSLIHANYLTGLAYEALEMRAQSQLRFEAVRRQNPHYRDVEFKL